MQENTRQPPKQIAEAKEDLLAMAVDHHQSGRSAEAEAAYRQALEARPDYPEAHYNLAILLRGSGRLLEAEAAYRKVLELRQDFPEAYNNLGNLLKDAGRPAEAELAYRRALECRADYVEAIYNLGTLLHAGNRLEEAAAAYRQALELRPDYAEFHNALGNLLYQSGRQDEALACFQRVLALNSNYPSALGMVAECQAWLCQWQGHQQTTEDLLQSVQQGRTLVPPLTFLHFCDDPLAQRRCAEVWANDRFSRQGGDAARALRDSHDRIRLAYISPDFRSHAVAYLITDLIEQHDRSRFEVFGISIGPDNPDRWRQRLQKGFDHFLDLHAESDEAVAQRLRALDLDIAVDLAGYTVHSRTGILASRPAPIQVNYLGFPGSMGAPFIDYLLADRFVIPEAFEPCYTEKVVCLPETFQCSSLRRIAERTPARRDLGLPASGFVFCCFNSTYKIQPPIFDIWMRLLARVEGSVLWLLSANETSRSNLRREAEARGVDPERLLFAPPLPLPEYLARYRQADLFLDTLPYNAGTTASDALWAGLPVLTCAGRSFASRMGGSLLQAAKLPELITDHPAAYEAVALRLATQPEELAALRQRLEVKRRTQPLFNVDRFRRHIEAAYQGMWEIRQRGDSPISFAVAPIDESGKTDRIGTGADGIAKAARPAAAELSQPYPTMANEAVQENARRSRQPAAHAKPRSLKIAIAHQQAGRFAAAEAGYQQQLREHPDDADAWHLLGVVAAQQEQYPVAVERIQRALELRPHEAVYLDNLGKVLMRQGGIAYEHRQYDTAIEYLDKALALAPDVAESYNLLGCAYLQQRRSAEATAAYRKALEIRPDYPEVHNNLANLLKQSGRQAEAEGAYRQALKLRPEHADVHCNLGHLLVEGGRTGEAEAAYRKALDLRPDYPEAQSGLGNLLHKLGRYSEALACLTPVLAADSYPPFTPGIAAACTARICEWQNHRQTTHDLIEGVRQGRKCVTPFVFLYFCDQPPEQRRCAEIWAREWVTEQAQVASPSPSHSHDRIRLAYVSPDFRSHPVAYLIADLIEQHDRSRFEVFAISIGPNAPDPWRERLMKAFDHFLDMRGESDETVAKRLRMLEIDIAVDLAGYTTDNRAGIFARRPAPVQVNYLGFPGSMGADFMDYIVADRFVIPEASEADYTEKAVFLPDTFQCSPPRNIAEQTPSRGELGLPETGFVFCCFNQTYKIHPQVFDLWMRLLSRVEGSVLWLFKANDAVEARLRREAEARGVNPDRLVFAARLPLPQHLARYRQADLFLDTSPYNAGTTASDALWAGLPVLTLAGPSFASRMGGSLLQALNLPELITDDPAAYEAMALRLATPTDELAALRQRLEENRRTQPLFNVDRFRRHIEAAYQGMWEIRQRGDSPISFAVSPIEADDDRANTGAADGSSAPTASASSAFHPTLQTAAEIPKQVLHVGCGPADPAKLPLFFRTPAWREVRLDVDPACAPDIVASMTSMAEAATAGFAAVFSSHNLEHLYPHEVPAALAEFHRVLTADGFALITVPDLQSVARLIADDQLEDIAYTSAAGPIAPLDMVYGLRPALARGNLFMAHRTGFTASTLSNALRGAGFAQVSVKRIARFGLWAVACRQTLSDERLASLLTAVFPSERRS